jgi:large subunit ribosomal protein L29
MQFSEITDFSDEKLVHTELELERELIAARIRLATNQLEDTSNLKKLRRDIARLHTAARTRETEQGLNKNALRDKHRGSFAADGSAKGGEEAGGRGFLKGIVDKISGSD